MASRLFGLLVITLFTIGPTTAGWVFSAFLPTPPRKVDRSSSALHANSGGKDDDSLSRSSYNLGLGKNKPVVRDQSASDEGMRNDNPGFDCEKSESEKPDEVDDAAKNWVVHETVRKRERPSGAPTPMKATIIKKGKQRAFKKSQPVKTRRMVARDDASRQLRGALWDEQHFDASSKKDNPRTENIDSDIGSTITLGKAPARPTAFYPDIDLSIPDTVYSEDGSVDLVWDLLRWEAWKNQQEQHEPLLVSFLHSSILNHNSLESSLAFLLANRLQSPAMMISTQLQALIYEALQSSWVFRRNVRADIMAVRDRDPACLTLPDVFLYFKGYHALVSHRVAWELWNSGRQVLAQYLQSQVSQVFQIDLHPNATLGSGIMLDHGTGIVIGETATVGHNCSILHHVTLGGSGKKGVVRHPSVGDGVLLGAGATVLGPVKIGEGSQVGAGTLVISDLPAHCVAVGVPARIIGSFVDITEQPSTTMNQIMDDIATFESEGI